VFPQEIENCILEMDNIRDVTVYKEPNPLTGNVVCAKVSLVSPVDDPRAFGVLVKKHCRARLQKFKVPVKVKVVEEEFMSVRGKKRRADT
jgi:acyl-coenzyme A synthetase/AMP-(fatty) acid ligase